MKKITIKKLAVAFLLMVSWMMVQAEMASIIIYEELEAVYPKDNKIVIAGKILKFKNSVEESIYRSAEDAKTLERLSQLKIGEKYYFEVVARDEDIRSRKFNEVIFISKVKPSE
ncbi:MAG: hypothetical protein R3E90_12400 [Marinicella sp.]